MSAINRSQFRPQYPAYNEYGFVPRPAPFGPADLWPSGHNTNYTTYASAHGRHLAGVDDMHAEGIDTYPNELNVLAAADDVGGNGVFDPNGSHGNVHPDEGVFQDHMSLPGYLDREVFYTPSEVQDIPGGGLTMYVPGGAVSFQQGQPETLREQRLLWELPPSVAPFRPPVIPQHSTVSGRLAQTAVGETPEDAKNRDNAKTDNTKKYAIALGVGVAAGIGLLLLQRKGK